jgi:hypothetical protein
MLRGRIGFVPLSRGFWDEGEVAAASLHHPVSTTQRLPSKKTVRMGDVGKAVRRGGSLTALLFEQAFNTRPAKSNSQSA